MTRTNTAKRALLAVASFISIVLPTTAHAKTITIATDKYWTVADSERMELGSAQNVCRFAAAPEGCPQGATLFGAPQWVALPGANWIWAPNTTATSSAAADQQLTFKTPFYLCGAPLAGDISVAADNSAEIFINGSLILSTQDFSSTTSVAIAFNKLNRGLNFIEAKVKNAPNHPDCPDQYQCNPAGVIVKLTVTDDLDPWPTCRDGNATFQVGEFLDLPCPAGQEGSNSKVCICVGDYADWLAASNSCRTPPPPPVTCIGADGAPFNVNETEAVACPERMVGSALRTCQSSGQWSSPDFSRCSLPTAEVGGICRDNLKVEIATCPAGTTCGSRRIPPPPRPWWCPLALWIPSECRPVTLQTADWFCD